MSEKRTGRPCGFRAARPDNTDHHHSDQSGRHSPRKNPAQGLNHAANAGRHALADRGHDLYETPPEAVLALLSAERLPQIIWEPACGPGAIVGVLRAAGHTVTATDLRDYGCPNAQSRIDFLLERRAPVGVEAIITNPPYKLADQFVAHALDLVPKVCMLLRLAFLESERRTSILESGRRARIHVFRDRLPMMHRFGWSGPRATSSIPFAWFVFDHKRGGPTVIDRITARQSSSRAHAATLVPIFIRRHNSNQEENSKCRKLKTQQK